jgi:PAS domain S-box-containing protein
MPSLRRATAQGDSRTRSSAGQASDARSAARNERHLKQQVETLRENVEALKLEKFKSDVSRERYAALYHFAPSGHMLLSAQGRVIDANLMAALLLGRKRAEIINSPFSLYVERKDLGRFLEHLRRCREDATKVCTELEIRFPDRGSVPVQLITVPLPATRPGLAPCFQVALVSLVELKQIERSLRTSEEQLRLALQCASAGTWEIDLAAGTATWTEQTHTPSGANTGAQSFTIEALIDRIHPRDRERAEGLIERVFHGQAQDFCGEFRVLQGGSSRWIAMLGRVVQEAGETGRRLMGISVDITERKNAEDALQEAHETLELTVKERTAELSAANAELQRQIIERRHLEQSMLEVAEREQRRIGQDLHDSLGQQLTGVAMFQSVLQQSLSERALPEAETVARVGSLLEDIREDLRRIVAGLHPVAEEPDGLMSGLGRFTTSICELYRVDCRFECPNPVLIHDKEVATHLFRIAQEAVGNAFRHGKAKRITVSLRGSDSEVVLEIRDDGHGMPKHSRKLSGFGVQIMKSRAEAIGGNLEIFRLQGNGTLIRCSVPEPEWLKAHDEKEQKNSSDRKTKDPARGRSSGRPGSAHVTNRSRTGSNGLRRRGDL